MIMTYISQKGKWSFPIVWRPTTLLEENMTPEMKITLDDIKKFKENAYAYLQKGVPYRHGYFLFGQNTPTKRRKMADRHSNISGNQCQLSDSSENNPIKISKINW